MISLVFLFFAPPLVQPALLGLAAPAIVLGLTGRWFVG
jgi:hypothetical protein